MPPHASWEGCGKGFKNRGPTCFCGVFCVLSTMSLKGEKKIPEKEKKIHLHVIEMTNNS